MNKLLPSIVMSSLLLSAATVADDNFRFTGYARFGAAYTDDDPLYRNSIRNGINVIKTAGSQYALTGHLANQAMGIEIGFEKKWKANGSNWRALFMATDNYNSDPWRSAQAWAGGDNVIKSNPSAMPWAGQRYAQRVQMLLNNYKPLQNDGTGGGIDNIDLGFGKLSVSAISGLTKNGWATDSNGRYALMTSLKGVRITDGHTLDFFANYGFGDSRDHFNGNGEKFDYDEDAYQLGVLYNNNRKDGWTKYMVRYGRGVKENIVRNVVAEDGGSLGLFVYGQERLSPKFSIMYALSHEHNDMSTNRDGETEKWSQAVFRGGYYYTTHISTWLEAAYDYIDFYDGNNSSWKLTLSQNFSLGNHLMSRPIVHFYVSTGGLDTEVVANSGAKLGTADALSVGTYFEVFL
ncbi:carbohydrate porin [Aliagarivorans marinus]|uniref:carbohydrate porin n=1 Tax=Aliagarivorans marinus TaxID=561965 RepID=UPI00146FC14E|nr:carbohydrate porin [Aliagarivorans marinus]